MIKTEFNDNWTCNGRKVMIPHDAMLEQKRDINAPCGSAGAFFPGGSFVYEKTFERPEADHVLIQFEGVYQNARVFLNGKETGGCVYGYLPFFIDADAFLTDGENTLRVECEVIQPDSRWYTGAGIYRPVMLWTGPKNSIAPESVRISTVSADPAVIQIRSDEKVKVEVGNVFGEGTDFELRLPNAKLWSADEPNLTTAHITNGSDSEDVSFGIRKIEWSAKGLFVNGKETLLRGGCIHHDNGILGSAAWDEAEWRRASKMKEAGFNAVRSAHNPCSRAMLEACDRLGLYVMDESWDMWFNRKNAKDYGRCWREHYLDDLKVMVSRDFNHSSVLMYSVGNEVSEPSSAEGLKKEQEMIDLLHNLDNTRPVSGGFNLMIISNAAKGKGIYKEDGSGRDESRDSKMQGMNSTMFNMITSLVGTGMNKSANSKKADAAASPALDALDIAGYNYASGRYPMEGKMHPDRLIYGSETFPQDIAKNWAMVKKYPYLAGDFMWTAWDYLGEAGIGTWAYTKDGKGFSKPYPWLLADTGAMDILGNPNGECFWASAAWAVLDNPVICVQPLGRGMTPAKGAWRGTNAIPSWSWKGCEGEKAKVEVYTDAASIELQLNGRKVGTKKVKDARACFKIPYASGTLIAVAYDASGREIGKDTLSSAGEVHVCAKPEPVIGNKDDIVYVPVVLADENGNVESNADETLTVSVENGELLGFGSANPRTEESFLSGSYTTYYGRALAVVRGKNVKLIIKRANGEKTEIIC